MTPPRIFLLSPASTSGKRAQLLFNESARFDLAVKLRSKEGASLGEVFSFLSGLYFRGKLTYASAFAPPERTFVITSDRGLVPPGRRVTIDELREMAAIDIHEGHMGYRVPIAVDALALRDSVPADAGVVLLGSIATGKYVDVLGEVFGERLLFPRDFVGRGDMSRGGLLLRQAREGKELDYMPVIGATRKGKRPAKLTPTRNYHPSTAATPAGRASGGRRQRIVIPDTAEAELTVDRRKVVLTNLDKVFWPDEGITKRMLLQYYADVSDVLLPHLHDRAMVMKRYPNGIRGKCFFMKRAPTPRPEWIATCSIEHESGNIIDFPMIQDRSSLLWVINLGCIDLNQWYARCDDVDRPDSLNFDLDPVPGASWSTVREAALVLRATLDALHLPAYAKTSGSKGIHVAVPIVRGPTQKDVWRFAKALAVTLAEHHPKLLTSEYRVAKRPRGRVLVDYNQNAWGRTLASIYSVRPKADAPVSTPVTWEEIERGVELHDFTMATVPARVGKVGDLWQPLLRAKGRARLEKLL